MNQNLDSIFDEVLHELKSKSSDLNALVMEAKDLCSHYDFIKKDVLNICNNPSSAETKLIELREKFYILVKRINSLNKDISDIIFKK